MRSLLSVVSFSDDTILTTSDLFTSVRSDWGAGVFVYLTSMSAIFIGTIVMEGVNTSLMSKSAPKELDGFFNMGLLATLVGSIGRVVGDR